MRAPHVCGAGPRLAHLPPTHPAFSPLYPAIWMRPDAHQNRWTRLCALGHIRGRRELRGKTGHGTYQVGILRTLLFLPPRFSLAGKSTTVANAQAATLSRLRAFGTALGATPNTTYRTVRRRSRTVCPGAWFGSTHISLNGWPRQMFLSGSVRFLATRLFVAVR
jgi:hypothetical protein